nr:MAG TPA: hypothetical protein [Caudoviricetes sp.]DAY27327.1 MAG TPA: hypothetical protein [Caudoviricetes sp.]
MSVGNCAELFCVQRNFIRIATANVRTTPTPWTLQVG